MRAAFFGPEASTRSTTERLIDSFPTTSATSSSTSATRDGVDRLFASHARDLELVVHTAAQPSHDWAAREPHTDFSVNANGTLNLLRGRAQPRAGATFVFCSTNKVYGDRPTRCR